MRVEITSTSPKLPLQGLHRRLRRFSPAPGVVESRKPDTKWINVRVADVIKCGLVYDFTHRYRRVRV